MGLDLFGANQGGSGSTSVKAPARACTTAALPACTYSAGVLTANANGALAAQDDVTLIVGDSLFVPFQADGLQNGLYVMTSAGSGGSPWAFARRDDADGEGDLVSGCRVSIAEGTRYGKRTWRLDTTGTITIGTTAQTWTLDVPPRRAGSSAVLHWPCSEGTLDSYVTATANIGTGGTATMSVNGTNLTQVGPEGAICGHGAAYTLGAAVASANYSCASSIQPHASAVFISAIIRQRDFSSANGVITGLYTASGAVLELGVTNTGLPYCTAKIGGGVGSKTGTAAAGRELRRHQEYLLTGLITGTAVFVLIDGQQADASGATYVANNIDYGGASPTYTIGNTQAALAANQFVGIMEEIRYGALSMPTTLYDAIREANRMRARVRAL